MTMFQLIDILYLRIISEGRHTDMINFINALLSYLLLMAIIVVVSGCAIWLGITLRKRKNAEEGLDPIAKGDD